MVQKVFKTLIVHENAFNKALVRKSVKMLVINKEIQMIRHNKCFTVLRWVTH